MTSALVAASAAACVGAFAGPPPAATGIFHPVVEQVTPPTQAAVESPAAAASGAAATPPASSAESGKSGPDLVTLNFVAADLDAVVGTIGQMTNRTFIIDPRVRGQITLATPKPVTREDAYRMLLSVLRLQGFAVVEDGRFAKVVPESDAKLQSGRVDGAISGARGDQIVTQIFRINYESASNLVPLLRPLISPNNTISAYESNNTLVVTDYADNLRRIGRIIANIDVPGAVDLEVIPLKYGLAVDMATLVNKLLDEGRSQGTSQSQRVTLLAETRTNSLLLRASSRLRAEQAKSLIERLDQPSQRGGNINIVYLKNADAVRLAQTLRSIITSDTSPIQSQVTAPLSGGSTGNLGGTGGANNAAGATTVAQGGGASGSTGSSVTWSGSTASGASGSSGGVGAGMIQADQATNSLIINAPEPIYRNIRDIIEKLDVRRAQVFIETLIVEVNSDTAAEFGVQWLNLGNAASGTTNSVVGGQVFTNEGTSIVSAAQNLGSISAGLNIGVVRGSVTLPGIGAVTNLGFLAHALESTGNANILSTPNIMTLDNEEAKIVVGKNVPFITGSYANSATSSSSATVNPFQTIERKDVGITLRVKPQVSEGGSVRMQLFQEVSSVSDTTLSAGIVTNQRSFSTNVVVDDGHIIVLGGLVEDSSSNSVDKVPLLGSIPVVGNLFRSEKRSHTKTNLMVFLRPYVIRDDASSSSVVLDRYEYMRARGQDNKIQNHLFMPDIPVPELAPLDQKGTVKPPAPLIAPPAASGAASR